MAFRTDKNEFQSKRWLDYVTKAKALLDGMNKKKMEVAGIALECCRIEWGGCRRGTNWTEYQEKGLKRFCADVGISYSTLWDWIQVKKMVHDKLPEGELTDFEYVVAKRTAYEINRDKTIEPVQQYRKNRDRHGSGHRFDRLIQNVRSSVNYISMPDLDLKHISDAKLNQAHYLSRKLDIALTAIKAKREKEWTESRSAFDAERTATVG